jgi:hypothetical protein
MCHRLESRHGDQTCRKSQKLLAVVQDTRHALRDAERMARATRTAFVKATLERACSTSRNRLMRTRLSGGVGTGTGNRPGYRIYVACLNWRSGQIHDS